MGSEKSTFWLAYIKNETPVLGKITLGEFLEGSKYLRTIADVDLIMGESVNIYWPGGRTGAGCNPAIFDDKQAALDSLQARLGGVISEHDSRLSKLREAMQRIVSTQG